MTDPQAPKKPSSHSDWGFIAFMIIMAAAIIGVTAITIWRFLR